MLSLICLLLLWPRTIRSQPYSCHDSSDCERLQGNGSVCRDDHFCSNAYEQGCLFAKLPGWTKLRVCNSDDPETVQGTLCRPSPFQYMEIRISTQNWESVVFESWILQILLSEKLGIPTTLETGTPEVKLNFYDTNSSFQLYDVRYDWSALERATELRDCQLAHRDLQDPNIIKNYQSCAHVIPEVWEVDLADDMVKSGVLQPPQGLGAVGQGFWFIPRFTAFQDPSLLSYLGLQGDDNRRKLADTFLRPTTWKDYCTQVSTTNCSADFGVALRPPMNESEYNRMFVPGIYFGHFRKTEDNDCDKWPHNCTGHIADFPCGWSSFVTQLTYHLDIALKSSGSEPGCGGYSFAQLREIWDAANWTNSNVIMNWWTPELLYEKYLGSTAEFWKVSLPPATQQCIDHRVSDTDRCNAQNATARYGSPLGACEEATNPLSKILSRGLFDATYDAGMSEALISPGYSAISLFSISTLQLGEIYDLYISSLSPREAVCQWIVDNLDIIDEFVPSTYPRVIRERTDTDPILNLCISLGGLSCFLVLCTFGMVYHHRKRRVMRAAQVEFMFLLLTGSFLITIGATMMGLEPSNDLCATIPWFISTGYTLQLVPLIVKVAAINRLMIAARQMKRVKISRRSLFGAVLMIVVINIFFLVLWTLLDPQQKVAELNLTTSMTNDGETIVWMRNFCGSQSDAWWLAGLSWTALLLVCATVLAVQTRNVPTEFNESQTLSFMIYFNFVLILLRFITDFTASIIGPWKKNWLLSINFSIATIGTLFIYFLPKFMTSDHVQNRQRVAAFTDLARFPSFVRRSVSRRLPQQDAPAPNLETNQSYSISKSKCLKVVDFDLKHDISSVQCCILCGQVPYKPQDVTSETCNQTYISSNKDLTHLSTVIDDEIDNSEDFKVSKHEETMFPLDSVAVTNTENLERGSDASLNHVRI